MTSDNEPGNILLQCLSKTACDAVMTKSEIVHLDLREESIKPGVEIEYVDFPITGVISVLRPVKSGELTEVATVGKEGMLGFSVVLGLLEVDELAFCQVEGTVLRLRTSDFIELTKNHPELLALCHRYMATLFNLVAGNTACTRQHSLEERCGRWLLLTHDRCGFDSFKLTQEFLGKMLGVSRSGVNQVAGELSEAKLITYVRGKITILDRAGLENVSCDCYKEIRDYYIKAIGRYC